MGLSDLFESKRTLIMGIVNVTPDSFYDGGRFLGLKAAVEHATQLADEGADIIDVGGESSRPGADPVSLEEERLRVLPVIEALASQLDIPLSIDTCKSEVAYDALSRGVQIVNDISGLRQDPNMAKVVAESGAFVVIMHMKGTPKNMQLNPSYDDVTGELIEFFKDRVKYVRKRGVQDERIILDPGIGFGKRVSDNFVILHSLGRIVDLGYPVLTGPSRKSFIGITLNLPAHERLEGTASAVAASVLNGAKIVRVHDVKEMKRVITIADAINMQGAVA